MALQLQEQFQDKAAGLVKPVSTASAKNQSAVSLYKETLASPNPDVRAMEPQVWNAVRKELNDMAESLESPVPFTNFLADMDGKNWPLPDNRRDYMMGQTLDMLSQGNNGWNTVQSLSPLLPPSEANHSWGSHIWNDYFGGLAALSRKEPSEAIKMASETYIDMSRQSLTQTQRQWQNSLGGVLLQDINALTDSKPRSASQFAESLLRRLDKTDPIYSSLVTIDGANRRKLDLEPLDLPKMQAAYGATQQRLQSETEQGIAHVSEDPVTGARASSIKYTGTAQVSVEEYGQKPAAATPGPR